MSDEPSQDAPAPENIDDVEEDEGYGNASGETVDEGAVPAPGSHDSVPLAEEEASPAPISRDSVPPAEEHEFAHGEIDDNQEDTIEQNDEMNEDDDYEEYEDEEDEGEEEEEQAGEGERKSSSTSRKFSDPSDVNKKRAPTMAAHMQAELNKQKILKAREDREARKAMLDAQHHYLIETVASFIKKKPKYVEEFVLDSPRYLELMNKFFAKGGSKSIIFCYQTADAPGTESGRPIPAGGFKRKKIKRVMVSNGKDITMKNICIYFVRMRTDEKVAIKTMNEEMFFGHLSLRKMKEPGSVLTSSIWNLQQIYIRNLKTNKTWNNNPDPDIAEKIRHNFLTAIDQYTKFLCSSRYDIASRLDLASISKMEKIFAKYLKKSSDVLKAAKNPKVLKLVEYTVMTWCQNIEKVLALSKQMRHESDKLGPIDELFYWRNLLSTTCYIIQQAHQSNVVNFISVLVHAKSRVYRRWKDVDLRVTDDFNEAKDNVRYMYTMEKFCQPLYQSDPPGMIPHINSMMYTIRTIHTTSRYYNSSEKITALMVKISNEMLVACRRYLTNNGKNGVMADEPKKMVAKLRDCITLYDTYRGSYEAIKAELEAIPDSNKFNFSINNIFGRFILFCERLKKIIDIFEIFQMYTPLHLSNIDGIHLFSMKIKRLERKVVELPWDPLNYENQHFDMAYHAIRNAFDQIQIELEKFLDTCIESVPTPLQGLVLLERFKNLNNRCFDIKSKEVYLFKFYYNEIQHIKSVYEAEKNDTPIAIGCPPFAGRLVWGRHLYSRLEAPMRWFEEKTDVLKLEESKAVIKLFNNMVKKLVHYEVLFHDAWNSQAMALYDSLESPLLTMRGSMKQEFVLNFDPFFTQSIEETDILRKLDVEVPEVAMIIYLKQDELMDIYEKMNILVERFRKIRSKIPVDLLVLARPLLKKVERSFHPGLTSINWTSFKCDEFFLYVETHLMELEEVIEKVVEIINIRIAQCLFDITRTSLTDFPDNRPMRVEEYMDRIRRYAVIASRELEYKSRDCESAAIDVINSLLEKSDINAPEEMLYSWMNPNLITKGPVQEKLRSAESTTSSQQAASQAMTHQAKEELIHLHEECRHVFALYGQKCVGALQKMTRISLENLHRRTEEPVVSKRSVKKPRESVPVFLVDLKLQIPRIVLKPTPHECQTVLNKSIQMIVEPLRHVIIWGQQRRSSFEERASNDSPFYQDPKRRKRWVAPPVYSRLQTHETIVRASIQLENINAKLKNVFKTVMEYKDINKMVLMMQTSVNQHRERAATVVVGYLQYKYLWNPHRQEEVHKRMSKNLAITEVESIIRRYQDLEEEMNEWASHHRLGPLSLSTKELRAAFLVEIKEWKTCICRCMSEKYRVLVFKILKFIDECEKELTIPLKDLNDFMYLAEILDKVKRRQYSHETIITPIEECYSFLNSQRFNVPDDESNRAFTLRYNYTKLHQRVLEVEHEIQSFESTHKKTLLASVEKFKRDLTKFHQKYTTKGPMVDWLSPQDASDRLVSFQDEFDELFERYDLCHSGEILFGLPREEYPVLFQLKKELALLQKLYGLYNDVSNSISSYYESRWTELDIKKINDDLLVYQERCRKLPKGLKDWTAFLELKWKIDDFKNTCPLLELMTNKAVKDRHWEKLGDIADTKFEFDSENFSLKNVMEANLLKFKEDVVDVCIGAQVERDIDGQLKKLAMDWSLINLHFAPYKYRGDLLLKKDETELIVTQLEESLVLLRELNGNKYSGIFRRELSNYISDFQLSLDLLKSWLICQDYWMYFESIFTQGDIPREMPQESKRFRNIDRTWVKVINRAREKSQVLVCFTSDETMEQLVPHLREQFQMCEKAIGNLL